MAAQTRKQLIWHIGDPKTGTTSIQRAFETDAIQFHDTHAECFKPKGTQANSVALAKALRRQDTSDIEDWFGKVGQWADKSTADCLIVSAEDMSSVKPMLLDKSIRKYLPAYASDAKVISYARPHASRFLAAFMQRTKTGQYKKTYEEFFDIIKKQRTLFYTARANLWKRHFLGNYTLRPFVRSEFYEKDAVQDFLAHTVGKGNFSIENEINENTTFSTRTLVGLRELHARFSETMPLSRGQKNLARSLYHYHIPAKPSEHQPPALDIKSYDILYDTYLEDAKQLDKEYFSRPIMFEALEKGRAKAADEPINLEYCDHFSLQERTQLEGLFKDVIRLYDGKNQLWFSYVQNMRNASLLTTIEKMKLSSNIARVKEMDALLVEIANILR